MSSLQWGERLKVIRIREIFCLLCGRFWEIKKIVKTHDTRYAYTSIFISNRDTESHEPSHQNHLQSAQHEDSAYYQFTTSILSKLSKYRPWHDESYNITDHLDGSCTCIHGKFIHHFTGPVSPILGLGAKPGTAWRRRSQETKQNEVVVRLKGHGFQSPCMIAGCDCHHSKDGKYWGDRNGRFGRCRKYDLDKNDIWNIRDGLVKWDRTRGAICSET